MRPLSAEAWLRRWQEVERLVNAGSEDAAAELASGVFQEMFREWRREKKSNLEALMRSAPLARKMLARLHPVFERRGMLSPPGTEVDRDTGQIRPRRDT